MQPAIEQLEARRLLSTSVFTYHYDPSRTGADSTETTLTPATVASASFGQLLNLPVDGHVYAEPLYVPNLVIPGQGTHNVVFVATEYDSVYAFDADTGVQLWRTSLLGPGETPGNVTATGIDTGIAGGWSGITGTPVIDSSTNTMYVVAKSQAVVNNLTTTYARIHALSITTGAEVFSQPTTITATVAGTSEGSSTVTFNPFTQLQRGALALDNGVVYVDWCSGNGVGPWHGWVMGYSTSTSAGTLQQVAVFCDTPNGPAEAPPGRSGAYGGGIWMSGGGPIIDSSGDLYYAIGDGNFDPTLNGSGFPANGDYGDSFVKLTPNNSTSADPNINGWGLGVTDYFAPSDQALINAGDLDLGSGGLVMLVNQPGAGSSELIGSDKSGNIYVINAANMGKYDTSGDQALQELNGVLEDPSAPVVEEDGSYGTPAYFNNVVYFHGANDVMKAFTLTNGLLQTPPAESNAVYQFPGATPVVSANGTSNGIVWEEAFSSTGNGTLSAYNLSNLSTPIFSTSLNEAADKFAVPTVADGQVFVGGANSLLVYGLKSSASGGSLSGTAAAAAASYNLTTLGTTDWAHWGTGNAPSAFDHKATGGSQISNVSKVGNGGSYGSYFDPSRKVSWTDGTPLASDSGDDAYIWANTALGAGYSFTVPASTTAQTLYVYAGGYSSGAQLTAHLSDGSAADYVATASGNGLYSNLYTITYKAASAGQTLTISYVKTTNINGTGGSVDLIAAALVGTPLPDTAPPTASITIAPPITAAASTPYSFTVTYTDNVAVNAMTLGNGNLLVTGTGYSQPATLVSTGSANGPTIVATYSVPAPSGGWSNSSDGTYTIALQANQVADTSGNYAAAVASLGTFNVNIPLPGAGSLSGSQAAAASSYNLSTLGTTDWAHWGTGNVASAFDHKATGGSEISNVTKLGAGGNYGSYYSSLRGVSWTGGSPLATDAGDDAYIWANTVLGAGYSFTVPASTTAQTLYVYAGGYSSGGQLTAHLSDGSSADYVATASGSGVYSNLYTITYKAGSAGQTLTISYVKTSNINGTGGSVDLIAAALVGTPVPDTMPPTASVTSAPPITAASSGVYTFTVTYADNVAVNASTLGNNNLLVTGTGYSQTATLVSSGLASGPSIVATYSVPAPSGGWSNSSNGAYNIALQANQVADTSGNYATAVASLGTFTVNIPVPGAGSLSGSPATAAGSYNLTTLGTTDWAHWGTGNVASAFDHKATGGSQISNVTKLGTGGNYGSYYSSARGVSWTNGSPLASDSGDDAYIWANTALGAGYSFTVPAGTTTHTLYVYAGGYSSGGQLTAHLSDGSAADYVATASSSGLYTNLYTITYKAASAGQTLTISYLKTTNINGTGGSVDLIAAALV